MQMNRDWLLNHITENIHLMWTQNDRDINVIYGNDEGEWGSFSADCPNGVCGIQTRVNPTQAVIDNTAVNNVRFECCA